MKSCSTCDELLVLVQQLTRKVKELEDRLSKYENPKNSSNSSVAPSQDPLRKTKSLRATSKNKQVGQLGHKRSKLSMVSNADTVVVDDIDKCNHCDQALPNVISHYDAHQVFDIVPITIKVTEHRRSIKVCECCGKQNKGEFPEWLVGQAQYGANLKALHVARS